MPLIRQERPFPHDNMNLANLFVGARQCDGDRSHLCIKAMLGKSNIRHTEIEWWHLCAPNQAKAPNHRKQCKHGPFDELHDRFPSRDCPTAVWHAQISVDDHGSCATGTAKVKGFGGYARRSPAARRRHAPISRSARPRSAARAMRRRSRHAWRSPRSARGRRSRRSPCALAIAASDKGRAGSPCFTIS